MKKYFISLKQLITTHKQNSHSLFDDFQGVFTGLFLLSFSVLLFQNAGLYSGGVSGLALAVSYATGLPVGILFFLISCPFFVLAYLKLGKAFTIKSLIVTLLISSFITFFSHQITISEISPYFSACIGGLLAGTAMIQLFRHKASAGGVNILAVYSHDKFGWNIGLTQFVLDGTIVMLSVLSGDFHTVIASIVAMMCANLSIAFNHRKGRYFSF